MKLKKPLYEEKWMKLESTIIYCQMLANSLFPASDQLRSEQFIETAAAAFYFIANTLQEAVETMMEHDVSERFKILENWNGGG